MYIHIYIYIYIYPISHFSQYIRGLIYIYIYNDCNFAQSQCSWQKPTIFSRQKPATSLNLNAQGKEKKTQWGLQPPLAKKDPNIYKYIRYINFPGGSAPQTPRYISKKLSRGLRPPAPPVYIKPFWFLSIFFGS